MSITRRNKKKWLKENPEWEEWTNHSEIGMLVQIWYRQEEHPRMAFVIKKGPGTSFTAKLFDQSSAINRDRWWFVLKKK